jgi:putative redox protein
MARNVCTDAGPLRFIETISIGPHVLQADEPSPSGGADAGPDPLELVLAALGSCASITIRMYADRKQWPLQGVHVCLSYATKHAEGYGESDATVGMGQLIEMEISVTGDLSDDQRRRLLEIANRCPVHRMLESQVQIRARLRDPEYTGQNNPAVPPTTGR